MGTCCQAGERNVEGKADPPSRAFGAARSAGQRTEARGQKPEDGGEFTSILHPKPAFLSLSLHRWLCAKDYSASACDLLVTFV